MGQDVPFIPDREGRAGVPDLWLEVRPVGAGRAQPKIDCSAVTLTVGVQAETRCSRPRPSGVPFSGDDRDRAPMEQGASRSACRSICPFAQVNTLIEAQLRAARFPKTASALRC